MTKFYTLAQWLIFKIMVMFPQILVNCIYYTVCYLWQLKQQQNKQTNKHNKEKRFCFEEFLQSKQFCGLNMKKHQVFQIVAFK